MVKRLFVVFALLILLLIVSMTISPLATADGPIIGEIRIWPSTTVPAGWQICDGTSLSKTTYSELDNVLSCAYGCDVETFNVPNLDGRVVVGRDVSKTQFDGFAETGGEIAHTLTINEMPAHDHSSSNEWLVDASALYTGSSNRPLVATSGTRHGYIAEQNTGGGQAHNNLQPYMVLYYIIYTGVGGPTPTPTATPTATITPTATSTSTTFLPIMGVVTGSLTITQPLNYGYTTTLTTGNDVVFYRSATYGEIITGAGMLMLVLGLVFYGVIVFTSRPGS